MEAATVGDSDVAAQAFEMMWVDVKVVTILTLELLGDERLQSLKNHRRFETNVYRKLPRTNQNK